MNFDEAVRYLHTLAGESHKLVLEHIEKIVSRLSGSLRGISFLQVAGTNGKGSTASYIAAALRAAGMRVGLFTSPHLQDVRERIVVDGRCISRQDFASCVGEVKSLCERLAAAAVIPNPPTFFEQVFLAALLHFRRQRLAWVVLEVGLGGRLDATSTVTPKLSVITNISKDHTNVLGRTIERIAAEKAGIIRPKVPVVCGCEPGSKAYQVIAGEARQRGAPFLPVFHEQAELAWSEGAEAYRCRYRDGRSKLDFRVRMRGPHQCRNAAVAVKALWELRRRTRLALSDRAIAAGIARTVVPARIERFGPAGGMPAVILDGGHNPEGIRVLADYLLAQPRAQRTLIFGVLRDKDYRTMAKRIAPAAETVILTRPASPRALDPEKLVALFPGCKTVVETSAPRALEIAKKIKKDIIVSGSLYLAGELRPLIARRRNQP